MVRIFGSPGRSRRLRVGVALAACTALVVVMALPALAVHEFNFQLDGDIDDSTTTTVGGDTQTVDWETLFDASVVPPVPVDPLPAGFDSAGFDRDLLTNANGSFNTSDGSTFATGSKDTLPITPGWQCNFDNNVNSKTDVMNAYAASFIVPSGPDAGDEILYFGLERNANTGTGNVGFWFLQDEVGCESAGGSTAFAGDHTDGDILVVSEFTQGGSVSTINAYRWDGGANGVLNPGSVAEGADCGNTAAGDDICANVNSGTLTGIPWLTSNKQDGPGNQLRSSEFFEGGINLTDTELGGKCFNVFIGDTRSSTSLTATIFDYSLGQLGACESEITTTPKMGDGTTNITSEPIPATGQLSVTDSALVEVTGADTFDATVTFFLCRESELVDANGDADPDTGTCAAGGTQIGDPKPVTTSPSTVVSDAAGLTAAERYCWRGEFSGDDGVGVPGDTDSSAGECFEVTPLTPTLTTEASDSVVLGNPIYDTISLTGTADTPGSNGIGPGGTIDATDRQPAGGTISVTAYGPDDPTCTTEAVGDPAVDWPVTITVSGDNAAYGGAGSVTEFTPVAVGNYTFVASYDGNSPNTLAAGPSACDDANEQVEVTGEAALSTAQDWLPNDTATLTGPTNLDGTLTFTLYNSADCTGTPVPDQEYTVDVDNAASGSTFSTSNTTFKVTFANAGNYSWLVHYDDNVLGDPDDTCETTSLTIDDDVPVGTP